MSEDWQIGGSADADAHAALGFSEAEAAQLAVDAYYYAWSKVQGSKVSQSMRSRAVYEFCSELEAQLRDYLGIEELDDA